MKITSFTVLPDTPEKLKHLNDLAFNLYFSWNTEVQELFRKLDPESWEASHQNPARMLCLVPQEKLNRAANNKRFLTELEVIYSEFRKYLEAPTWYDETFGKPAAPEICYFCAEFGLHECLPVYSGGLGVLAGDHIKSASDLGLPLIGVGLLYRQGYFRQYLNAEGMQQERYPENDWYSMPVYLEKDENGVPLKSSIMFGNDKVWFQIWRVDVGRSCIYLLDTNLEANEPVHRDLTKILYDSDRDTRARQEILLGIGGVRALRALGLAPSVFHVNEGHSAFLILERLHNLMTDHGLTLAEAKELVWSTTVFTTHTPVPAGNERFRPELLEPYLARKAADLGMSWSDFLSLGREDLYDESFSMTALALRYAAFANGVSRLHGQVTRKMFRSMFPGIPEAEVPIRHVTNGVHTKTWLNPRLCHLLQRYSDAEPSNLDEAIWRNVQIVPDDELWELHEFNRQKLVEFVRRRVSWQLKRRGARPGELSKIRDLLDPNALTIGFARRFTTYKRGYLFLMNPERLKQIFCNPDRPVQIIIAGKAHSADHAAKEIIRQIFELSNQPEFRHHIVFLEDYDLTVARHLVQGVDLWLNNPRRPLEASGTSGMKAALNGALNLSVLDGWWDEAFSTDLGWAIGQGETFEDHDLQDRIESDLFYGNLEREIVPLFYDRDEKGLPHNWLRLVKRSIATLGARFNSSRMLREYVELYRAAGDLHDRLADDDFAKARGLAEWRRLLHQEWDKLRITKIESPANDFIYKGTDIEVRVWIRLNNLQPEHVIVECYHGPLDGEHRLRDAHRQRMDVVGQQGDETIFSTSIRCTRGGHYGHTVRVLPGHEDLAVEFLPGFMKWVE